MFSQTLTMDSPSFNTNESPVKLQHLCRMCATPCNKSVPIFGPGGEENDLATKFNNYLPLKVSETDSIPLQLCYECTNLLIQWDAAILVAVAADKKLRALLWREQQTQQFKSVDTNESEQDNQLRKRKRSSSRVQESLSCSVCNKSGMDFRELVEHLKTHDRPVEETERSSFKSTSRFQNSSSSQGDVDCSIGDLLTPVVCLETFDPRQLRSMIETSDSTLDNSNDDRKPIRGRPKKSSKSVSENKVQGDLDDPMVTSSTSTPHRKSADTLEIDSMHSSPRNTANNNVNSPPNAAAAAESNNKKEQTSDSQNNAFKPKVRIISAESINQTLEERAKANQTARNLESYQPPVGPCSPPSSGPLLPTLPSRPSMKRLVLSGQVVKGMNFETAGPGQKFLKLSDGRIIKIIQGNSTNSIGSSAQVKQKVQILSAAIVPNKDKPASTIRAVSPDKILPQTLVNKLVQVGDKRFKYTCQPGPKQCPNRYICGVCGKRNLNQESLQEHSELHACKDDKTQSN